MGLSLFEGHSELEEGVLGVGAILSSLPGEALDGIGLVVCSKCK